MPRSLLIVDDDGPARRGLRRAVSARVPNLDVEVACDGIEAVDQLEERTFDIVLTDIRMPRMDGFELLTWLAAHRPDVRAIAMTAHETVDTSTRVSERGGLRCLCKPIDLDALERMLTERELSVWGHVANIDTTAFLQLVEMERKTCTLHVAGALAEGWIHIDDGTLLDAETSAGETGDSAVIALVGSPQAARIAIGPLRAKVTSRVTSPMSFLLMEAMRRRDELSRTVPVNESPTRRMEIDPFIGLMNDDDDGPNSPSPSPPVAATTAGSPPAAEPVGTAGRLEIMLASLVEHPGMRCAALIDAQQGLVLAKVLAMRDGTTDEELETFASHALDSIRVTRHAYARVESGGDIEEIAVASAKHRLWLRAMGASGGVLLLVGDAERTSPAIGSRYLRLAVPAAHEHLQGRRSSEAV